MITLNEQNLMRRKCEEELSSLQNIKHGKRESQVLFIAEQITVMYPNSLTNTQNHFFIPVSEVYKNEWEIRYSGDGLRTVQEYKEAADES